MLNDIARPLHAVKERYKVSSGGDAGGNKIYMLIFFSNLLGGELFSN